MASSREMGRYPDDDDPVSLWIGQLKGGDADAARGLWEHYYSRLVGLARKKLGDLPRRGADEEDVVLSAIDTFCRRAQAGNFPELNDRDGLWPLLALITARKAAKQRRQQGRVKRGGGLLAKQTTSDSTSGEDELAQFAGNEPSPADAAIFLAELERFMNSLDDPGDRLILLWKLEERTNRDIARHLDCSLSAVERRLRFIRRRLGRQVPDE